MLGTPDDSPASSAESQPTQSVEVLVLRTAGTNCDEETAHAFRLAGATVECLHVGVLLRHERGLEEFDALAIPGGFSYGDDLGAGTVLANQLGTRLGSDLERFVDAGKLMIGICNGFQVLVRLGILPGWPGERVVALNENDSGKFEDRWVRLRVEADRCPFLGFARETEPSLRELRLPVAHREGRFVLRDPALVERLRDAGQIALTYRDWEEGGVAGGKYPDNPNGSLADIAGISNVGGNVLGLMPHPERFLSRLQDPLWTRDSPEEGTRSRGEAYAELARSGDGFRFFSSAVEFAAERKKAVKNPKVLGT